MSELNTAATNILNRLVAAPTYHPGNADLFTDWNLQAGDVVTVAADGENYSVPIYNMKLKWTGQSKVEVESTGNPKREPPPAVNRKSYGASAGGYGGQKQLSDTLHDAGLFVDPETGVWAYASEQGADYALGSTFAIQSGRIQAEVTRATEAEGALSTRVTITEQGLTSKVSAGDIASTINQTAQSVLIAASKINLEGYVTADALATYIADIATLTVQDIDAGEIDCSGVEAGSLLATTDITSAGTLNVSGDSTLADVDAQDVSVSTLTIDGYSINPANLVASFGTNTGTGGQISIPVTMANGDPGTPITFDIADTAFYQQAVSAAWANGYSAGVSDASPDGVSITSAATQPAQGAGGRWYSTVTAVTEKNGETVNTYPNRYVDVTNPYNAGNTAGVSAGITTGQNNVVINKGTWALGTIEFTKSVGTASTKTVTLSGQVGTYESDRKRYIVSIYDETTKFTGLRVEVDATDAFNAGKNRFWRAGSRYWGYSNNGGATWNAYYSGTMFRSYDEA